MAPLEALVSHSQVWMKHLHPMCTILCQKKWVLAIVWFICQDRKYKAKVSAFNPDLAMLMVFMTMMMVMLMMMVMVMMIVTMIVMVMMMVMVMMAI